MNRLIFDRAIEEDPGENAHMFITDRRGLAENILLADQMSVLVSENLAGCFRSAQEFADHLSAVRFSGKYESDYIYVPLISRRADNDVLRRYLRENGYRFREGWRAFKPDRLERKECSDEVKEIMKAFLEEYKPKNQLFNLELTSLADIPEKQAEWLVPQYLPKNQVTIFAGEGGCGKTSLWCNVVAGISSGKPCVLEEENPFAGSDPGRVLIFSAEDSPEYVLVKKLRKNGQDSDI